MHNMSIKLINIEQLNIVYKLSIPKHMLMWSLFGCMQIDENILKSHQHTPVQSFIILFINNIFKFVVELYTTFMVLLS